MKMIFIIKKQILNLSIMKKQIEKHIDQLEELLADSTLQGTIELAITTLTV